MVLRRFWMRPSLILFIFNLVDVFVAEIRVVNK